MNSSKSTELQNEVLGLFAARRGHFRFESGHHGDLWLEIPPAYVHPKRLRRYASELAQLLSAHRIEAVCGPLVEGAFLAQMVAEEMDVEFYFAEQFTCAEKNALYPVGYRVPEALRDAIRGKRVAVVDDVINAGSAVRATCDDLIACGARLAAIGALLVLGTPASVLAEAHAVPLQSLSRLAVMSLWEPSACPLCANGVKLEGIDAP